MNIENQKDKPTWEGLEQYFAVEVIEQSKRNAKHWFIAFLVTLAALIGTNIKKNGKSRGIKRKRRR